MRSSSGRCLRLIVSFSLPLLACSSSTGSSGATGSDAAADAGGRVPLTCSQIDQAAESDGFTTATGSWGSLPAALRSVPPGGTLCGTQSEGDAAIEGNQIVVIDTPLSGQALLDFYAPLATALGCTQQDVPESGYAFDCPNAQTLVVLPNPIDAYVMITYGGN